MSAGWLVAVAALGACTLDREGLAPPRGDRDAGADARPDSAEDACPADPDKTEPGICGCGVRDTDSDGDRTADCEDCAPMNAAVSPAAPEVCNGGDDDCDGSIDESTCDIGCADGVREGFVDTTTHPNIAGCAGGWTLPGLVTTVGPACNRAAGDDASDPLGTGCNVVDLCEHGWDVCADPASVGARSTTGCTGAVAAGDPPLFFLMRQSGPGAGQCGPGVNDLFGCGNVGTSADPTTCAPVDRAANDQCGALGPPWVCPDSFDEANTVRKSGPERGGVLCCRTS